MEPQAEHLQQKTNTARNGGACERGGGVNVSGRGARARKISRRTPSPTVVIVPGSVAMNAGILERRAFSVPATAKSDSVAASRTRTNAMGMALT